MSDVITDKKNERKPSTALTLSLIMPGLGHIYCGRIAKGIILAFLSSILAPVLPIVLSLNQSSIRMAVIITAMFLATIIWLVAIIDSWYTARHTSQSYVLKDYNRWYIYLILVLMGTGIAIPLAFNTKATFMEAFIGAGVANYPTIVPGDRFLVNKRAYENSDPEIGDMVVFINPANRRITFIKRVIAIAGDSIEIKDGQVYVNDEKLQRNKLDPSILDNIRVEIAGVPLEGDVYEEINRKAKYKIILAKSPADEALPDFPKTTVPEYHCFVLGDNRNNSDDSRSFGPVPLATIKGRADYLYWPAKDWSRFGKIAD
jgi:signal peptidase I